MTAPDLDSLARATISLGEAATPGPWLKAQHGQERAVGGDCWWAVHRGGEREDGTPLILPSQVVRVLGTYRGADDAALIAAYRSSAPALATALLAAREAMREVVDAYDAGGERPSVVDQDRLQHAMSGLRDALRS